MRTSRRHRKIHPLLGPDTFTVGLSTIRRLDDFVAGSHRLRGTRVIVKDALAKLDG